jgi:hypothetical protein
MAPEIRLGTSAFSVNGWQGASYPKGMKRADYLNFYSTRFDTVEVDSTFYRCPTIEAVNNWALKTPPGFIFSVKIARTDGSGGERFVGDYNSQIGLARRMPVKIGQKLHEGAPCKTKY